MRMMLVSHVNARDLRIGLEYARRKLRKASIMGRIFGFSDDRRSVNSLKQVTGLIHGYIELAAALKIQKQYGSRMPLYVREVGDLSFLHIGREHLSNLPKIHAILSDERPVSDFILWNGKLLRYDEVFLPYFAGPRLADIELYEGKRVTLYDVTTGGRDVLRTKDLTVRRFRPSLPASEVSWKIFRFNWEAE